MHGTSLCRASVNRKHAGGRKKVVGRRPIFGKAPFMGRWWLLLGLLGACSEPVPQAPPSVPPPASKEQPASHLIGVTGAQLLEAVRARDARYVVVNVWATWCGPCREEFPYIQSVTRAFADRGVDLVFVTTDFDSEREAALAFLREQKADLPSYIKQGPDEAFIEAINPEWSGALPTTIVFDSEGRRVRVWNGKVERADLEQALTELVGAG
jgi:thiol-disulfide isomerase/thioredoxin